MPEMYATKTVIPMGSHTSKPKELS
jgi:hypothetical protein